MKENELTSSHGIGQQEVSKEDHFAKPLYGAIAWAGISVGTVVMALTLPRHNGQDVYQDDKIAPERIERQIERVLLFDDFSEEKIFQSQVLSDEKERIAKELRQILLADRGSERVDYQVTVKGPATYYGVYDGFGPEDNLGCTGEPFDPYDPTIAARPENSPFVCGDKVEVCDSDSCIDVEIKDTCPGCDDLGIVLDLSYGAMQKLSPGLGSVTVTLRELKG